MNSRKLGTSGLSVSEIAFGNWITHGAQVDVHAAQACVHAALEAGITTFDTADVYSDTRAEAVLRLSRFDSITFTQCMDNLVHLLWLWEPQS
ncbi:Aldo/keto reductase family protein [Paenibacillus sp. cl6col]|nr:Aldo/keto reductase family protein [Paenibacillus sp. cl6col]